MFTLGCGRFKSGIEPLFASLLRNELYGVTDRSIVIESFGVCIFVMTVRTCKCRLF
jgi:hypothetical protein